MSKKKLFVAVLSVILIFSLGIAVFSGSKAKPEEKIKAVIDEFYEIIDFF